MSKGFITVACNTKDIDYLAHATLLAESIKDTQQIKNVSLVTNTETYSYFTSKHHSLFDKILQVDFATAGDKSYLSETKVWFSPYKQTIKMEADMMMTSSIDHWWEILDQKDVVLTNRVETYWGDIIMNRSQRQLFDQNSLPDVYSAFYYFRKTMPAKQFFELVKQIFYNWNWFRDSYLKNCRYQDPVTDEVFAIAVKIFGEELCTLTGTVPSFVHMKNPLQNINHNQSWFESVMFERNAGINLGNYRQHLPLHYCDKKFLEKLND